MRFEEAVIEGGPIALPGAKALLEQIDAGSSPSARGWTIVTSGTSPPSPSLNRTLAFANISTFFLLSNTIQPRRSTPHKHSRGHAYRCPPRVT